MLNALLIHLNSRTSFLRSPSQALSRLDLDLSLPQRRHDQIPVWLSLIKLMFNQRVGLAGLNIIKFGANVALMFTTHRGYLIPSALLFSICLLLYWVTVWDWVWDNLILSFITDIIVHYYMYRPLEAVKFYQASSKWQEQYPEPEMHLCAFPELPRQYEGLR